MANYSGSVWSEYERIALENGWNITKEGRFQGALAGQMQQNINAVAGGFKGYDPSVASIKLDVDGDFGSLSRNAFDHIRNEMLKDDFSNLYGNSQKYFEAKSNLLSNEAALWNEGLKNLIELFSTEGTPAQRYVAQYRARTEGIKDRLPGEKPQKPAEKPFVEDTMPPLQTVEVGGEVPEVDLTKMKGASAKVVGQLVALANDLDEMGAEAAAIVVDKHLATYKVAMDKLYDVFGETGEDLVNMAHPGGGPTIVPASEEGGKVETIVEENKKLVDKVTKAPTGKVASLDPRQWYAGLDGQKQRQVRNYVSMLMQKGMDQGEALTKAHRAMRTPEPKPSHVTVDGRNYATAPSPGGITLEDAARNEGVSVEEYIRRHRNQQPKTQQPDVSSLKNVMPPLQEVEVGGEVVDRLPSFASAKPPKKYRETGATSKSDYADPDNFKYPIHTEKNVRAALSYFSKPKNYNAYSAGERSKIWSRIKSAAKKYKIELDPDNDPPWGKKSKKAYVETLQKLVKKANDLEDAGHIEAARVVDKAIRELQETVLPFVNRSSAIEAAGSEDAKASVKLAEGRGLKEQLFGYIKELYYKLLKVEDLIDSWGAAPAQMKELFKQIKTEIHSLASKKAEYSEAQAAQHLFKITSMITSTEIDIKDAFGSWDASDFWDFEKYARKVQAFAKGALEAAVQEDQPFSKKMELNNYIKLLDAIAEGLKSNYEGAKKVLGGPEKVQEYYNIFLKEKQTAPSLSANVLETRAKAVKQLAKALRGKKIIAAEQISLTKSADDFTDAVNSLTQRIAPSTTPAAAPKATNRRRRPGRKKDPNVENLQRTMMAAGIKIKGRNPDDGVWGPNTNTAYNTLRERIQSLHGLKLPAAPNERTAPPRLDLAQRAAQYLVRREAGSIQNDIEIAPGKTIPGNKLRSAKAFTNALVLNKIIEDTDHEQEKLSQAYDVLADFEQRINTDEAFVEKMRIELGDKIRLLKPTLYRLGSQLKPFKMARPEVAQKPEGDKKEPAASGAKSNKMDQALLRFDANDINSVIAAVNYLDPKTVANLEAFRNWVPGALDDPKPKYKQYRQRIAALSAALQRLRPTIEQSSGGQGLYARLFDKVDYFLRALNSTGRQMR